MREIKMRYTYQHGETGRIYSRIFTLNDLESGEVKEFIKNITARYFIVDKEQYTDLRDKNGKEIFEGDIVSLCTYSQDEPINVYEGEIIIGIYGIGIIGVDECGKEDCFWFRDVEAAYNHFEVIGNIHESPELLGIKKDCSK